MPTLCVFRSKSAHIALALAGTVALIPSVFKPPFGFLALAALGRASRLSERRQSLVVVCSGFALSLAIELTQVFLPTRSSSLTDLCANTVGTALGVLLFFMLKWGQIYFPGLEGAEESDQNRKI